MQGEAFRGVNSSNALSSFDAETTRGEQAAIADEANARRTAIGGAIGNAAGIAGGINSAAQSEKQLQLQAWEAQQTAQAQKANQKYQQWLALLQADRTSPVTATGATTTQPKPYGTSWLGAR